MKKAQHIYKVQDHQDENYSERFKCNSDGNAIAMMLTLAIGEAKNDVDRKLSLYRKEPYGIWELVYQMKGLKRITGDY